MHHAIEQLNRTIGELTDFQRATVDVVCARLMQNTDGGHRVLVADEVGLGKTLVARGVIATFIKSRLLADEGPTAPFRVAYICSNQALAQENLRKLAVFRHDEAEQWVCTPNFSRLAELGIQQVAPPDTALLELCSLTPATSFSLTQGHGNAMERCIIWSAVAADRYISADEPLERFFRKDVAGSWDAARRRFSAADLQQTSLAEFHKRLSATPDLSAAHGTIAQKMRLNIRSWRTLLQSAAAVDKAGLGHQEARVVSRVLGRVREMFVECCAQNLQADLFILDEFQRFRDLVSVADDSAGDAPRPTEQQVIARKVLHSGGPSATLLLSATPFKALSHLDEEDEGTAHSQEFGELLKYLCRSQAGVVESFQHKREALLNAILTLPGGPLPAGSLNDHAKQTLQALLRTFICRTERSSVLPDTEQSLRDVPSRFEGPTAHEIRAFVELDSLARTLHKVSDGRAATDVTQFFKAAPWCLSFLGGYQLREQLKVMRHKPELAQALQKLKEAWIPFEHFNGYRMDVSTSAPSVRFRQLVETAAPKGAERLLWLPPSLPYYRLEGPYEGTHGMSKTLLFSSLVLAPRALSSFVSYECERRLLSSKSRRPAYFASRSEERGPFRLDAKGISVAWGLAYPSVHLSSVTFPRQQSTLDEVRATVRSGLVAGFKRMIRLFGSSAVKKTVMWYRLAPFLIDRDAADAGFSGPFSDWYSAISLSAVAAGRRTQLERIRQLITASSLDLGKPPSDLLEYLVDLAIAGPGVATRRAFNRVWPEHAQSQAVLALSVESSVAMVQKMNRMESQRVLRAVFPKDKPWTAVVKYCAAGNLQAVMDEYFHLLRSSHGEPNEAVQAFKTAVGVGAVTVLAQTRLSDGKAEPPEEVRFHCHYAVPLGNQRGTDEKGVARITNLRGAFNSPFWPFMLNSTSIGQEGLDFHWYCRRVVHWSLPSNPIDLEQREGRVNRYKSLVVRQRAAQRFAGPLNHGDDVWKQVFAAVKGTGAVSDLIPYWHVPDASAQIERVIPLMPFSREVARRHEILRILSLYRLSFGQPRQQELVEELLRRRYSEDDLAEIRRALLVELAPIKYRAGE